MPTTTARRWAALIDQAERSGLTDRAFAEQAGVNPGTFGWWKWHLSTARKTTTVTACFDDTDPPVCTEGSVPGAPTGVLSRSAGDRGCSGCAATDAPSWSWLARRR